METSGRALRLRREALGELLGLDLLESSILQGAANAR
jgi:hypothetical protein